MTSYFALITNDARSISTERKTSAYEITVERLRQGVWPLYSGTRHRDAIAVGDKVLFYIGGEKENRQSFVASARVSAIDHPRRSSYHIDDPDLITGEPFKVLRLGDIDYFECPVSIRPLAGRLSFVPASNKWGTAMMGGCRRITAGDFNMVLQQRR